MARVRLVVMIGWRSRGWRSGEGRFVVPFRGLGLFFPGSVCIAMVIVMLSVLSPVRIGFGFILFLRMPVIVCRISMLSGRMMLRYSGCRRGSRRLGLALHDHTLVASDGGRIEIFDFLGGQSIVIAQRPGIRGLASLLQSLHERFRFGAGFAVYFFFAMA